MMKYILPEDKQQTEDKQLELRLRRDISGRPSLEARDNPNSAWFVIGRFFENGTVEIDNFHYGRKFGLRFQ